MAKWSPEISFEQIVTYIILPVFAAIGGIWVLLKRLAPDWSNATIERMRDEREYQQRTQADSLSQVLKSQDLLIADLMEARRSERDHFHELELRFVGFLADVADKLNRLTAIQERTKGSQDMMMRDWSRLNEIVADIDMILHELKAATSATTGLPGSLTSQQVLEYKKYLEEKDGIK